MIDPRIFEELKVRHKTTLKHFLWGFLAIFYFALIIPSPEFEANVHGEYKGKELIENLPEQYAYLADVVSSTKIYTVESVGFVITSIFMAALCVLCSIWIDTIFNKLREYDSPPPILPEKKVLKSQLIKFGIGLWVISVTALSLIWGCLSPEYILAGRGFWAGILANLPFWILVIAFAFLVITGEHLTDILDKASEWKKEDEEAGKDND